MPNSLQVVADVTLSNQTEGRLPRTWIALLRGRVHACSGGHVRRRNFHDVATYLLAGADVVMTASALLRHGPQYAAVLLDGLSAWMARQEFRTLRRGTRAAGCSCRHGWSRLRAGPLCECHAGCQCRPLLLLSVNPGLSPASSRRRALVRIRSGRTNRSDDPQRVPAPVPSARRAGSFQPGGTATRRAPAHPPDRTGSGLAIRAKAPVTLSAPPSKVPRCWASWSYARII